MGSIVIISDLHISAAELDDCDDELEAALVGFLAELGGRAQPTELVINGDFLDFVQAPPWSGRELQARTSAGVPVCFTREQSVDKFESIVAAHGEIFKALGRFLAANSENRLVVLPGNHDPDFFWPEIQKAFLEATCQGDASQVCRVRVLLERVYRPEACPAVWIEHGHQYDPVNSFFISDYPYWSEANPPILRAGNQDRLFGCLGTRFLIDYLNSLDRDYPFVDNVKPFSRFVRIFLASAVNPGFGPLKAAVAGWGILRYLTKLQLTSRADYLAAEEIQDQSETALLDRLRAMSEDDEAAFQKLNMAYPGDRDLRMLLDDEAAREGVLEWLTSRPDLLESPAKEEREDLLGIGDDRYLGLKEGFSLDETSMLVDGAIQILRERSQEVAVVIMGHTHEPVMRPEGLPYFNTGSWTRYYRFGEDDDPRPWSILQKGLYRDFPYQLLYAEIDPRNPSATVVKTYRTRNS